MSNKKFKTGNSKIDQRILELAELFFPSDTHEMHRRMFKFNKQSFGRLNKMIRSINEWVN